MDSIGTMWIILILLMLGFLSGCALTTDEVNLEYKSRTTTNVVPGANSVSVQVNVADGRNSAVDKVSVKKNG